MVQDVTIGGGTAYNELLAILTGILGEQRTSAAGTGMSLLAALLGAEQSVRSNPMGLVDRLALSGEVGNMLPFSQGTREQLDRFSARPQGNLVDTLTDQLSAFAAGAVPQGEVLNVASGAGYGPMVAVRLPDGRMTYMAIPDDWNDATGLRTIQGNQGPYTVSNEAIRNQLMTNPGALRTIIGRAAETNPELRAAIGENMQSRQQARTGAGGTQNFARGGRLRLDPRARSSTGSTVAAPVTIRDRTGQTVGVAGEAGQAETLTIQPPTGGGVIPRPDITPSPAPPIPPSVPGPGDISSVIGTKGTDAANGTGVTTVLSAADKFRLEQLREMFPDWGLETLTRFAKDPAALDRIMMDQGVDLDEGQLARLTSARLLAEGMAGDERFTTPFRRALALGRTPSPAELNARDYNLASRSPDFIGGLHSLISQANLPSWLMELAALSPRGISGVRGRQAGGVRL